MSKTEPDMDIEFIGAQLEDDSDRKRGSESGDTNAGSSRGSLIEDMYGVERRENQPYKKLKTNHEEKAQPLKGADFGPGSSGLGDWMKEDNGKSPSFSVATPDIVDLTAGMR